MTHLEIRQSSDRLEIVPASVINKLYSLSFHNDAVLRPLDNTSFLSGNIKTAALSSEKISFLNSEWQNLTVAADAYTVDFEDPVWANICATTWGDGLFVTRQQMAAVNYLPDGLAVNNSDLEVIDLGVCIMSQANFARKSALSNCPNVRKIIIGGVTATVNVKGFAAIMSNLGTTYLEKYVTGDCTSIPGVDGSGTVEVLGIKNVGDLEFGNYWTRGGRIINKLYIWSNTPPTYKGGYGDNASNVGVSGIFVPIGMSDTYKNNTSFNPNGQFTARIYEYDFDLDPDGVYEELKK